MAVVLTGDVHHMSLGTQDQEFMDRSEVELSLEYAAVAADHGIPVTLFITGAAIKEETEQCRSLANLSNVELGGHGFFASQPKMFYALSRRITGLRCGPAWFQRWEVRRTFRELEHISDATVHSWRGHGYRRDRNTNRILEDAGVTVVSNYVRSDWHGPVPVGERLTALPINTPPDHDYIHHASVDSPPPHGEFGSSLMTASAWVDQVLGAVEKRNSVGRIATVLAHPGCMHILDGFQTFSALCSSLEKYACKFAREVAGQASYCV